jgi:hypothetical protein
MNQMEKYREERWEKKYGLVATTGVSILFWVVILSILIIASK